jgi:hypothetical protein
MLWLLRAIPMPYLPVLLMSVKKSFDDLSSSDQLAAGQPGKVHTAV